MKRKACSVLLALALVACVIAFGSLCVSAEEEHTHLDHCICAGYGEGKGAHECQSVEDWTPWGDDEAEKTALPTQDGNYYLVSDLAITTLQNPGQIHLCLNGHTVKLSKVGRINVKKDISVTDCQTTGQIITTSADVSSSNRYKSMFYVYNGFTLDLFAGIYDARGAQVADGAIAHIGNDDAAYLNIYSGTYYGAKLTLGPSGLTQTRGGAFNITAGSVMTMYDGDIIGGESTEAQAGKVAIGGCVAIYSGTLNMFGGSITEGKANSVYLRNNAACHLNLSGNAAIDDLYVDGAKKFTVSEDFAGSVGLTVATKNHEVVTLKNAQQAACITSNEEGFSTKTTGSLGVMVNDDPAHANHCACAGAAAGKGEHKCEELIWQAWGYLDSEKTKLPTASGNYYLVSDLTLNAAAEIKVGTQLNLCLNGHNIGIAEGKKARLYSVRDKLGITDCAETQGHIVTTYEGRYGGVFFAYENSQIDIYGGHLDGSQGHMAQGGIVLLGNSGGAVMNIYGGTLTGTTTQEGYTSSSGAAMERRGATIYMISTSSLNIYGGTIIGGEAKNGGTIYASTNNTVNLYGGTIQGGSATDNGGNICSLGTLNITGGTITGGKALKGGNIYADKNASIANAQITDGIAHSDADQAYGGNLYIATDITVTNTTISGGMATAGVTADGVFTPGKASAGGNIMIDPDVQASFTGCTITGGQATHGGNFRVDGKLNLTDSIVSDGNATLKHDGTTNGNGGNLYCVNGSTTVIDGCTISGGVAERAGSVGAWGKVTIIDTSVTGGHANVSGGNIMTYNYGYVSLQGNTVISDGSAASNGGNLSFSSNDQRTNTIGDGVQVLDGTAEDLGDCIYQSGGTLKLVGSPKIAGIYAKNSDKAYGMDVSALNVTEPIHLGVDKLGVVATTTSDNSAMFAMVNANMALYFDSENNQLICGYREIENVYVDATNGNDDNTGAQDAPVKTFAHAMDVVKDGGTIHLVGTVKVSSWTAHGKSFTVTGDELVFPEIRANLRDHVTFENVTLTLPMSTKETDNFGSYFFYCNGYRTVFAQSAIVQYLYDGTYMTDPYHTATKADGTTVTGTSTLYGGGVASSGVLTGTDLTVLAGLWGNVYGGSNAKDIDGDVHLTVGGKINEGVDYVNHSHSSWHVICGGSRSGDISGTVYMNVIGGMNHTSTHGGSNGGTIDNIVMRVTGGQGMALYGGGRSGGTTVTGEINFYLEGGEWEQVFGGNLSSSLVGNVNIYVTGGKITRRLYGGCYSNCDESSGNWTADNFVTGDVNLYIGSGAEITCDLKDPNPGWESILTGGQYADRGIYGHSRRAAPGANDAENARIIFLDYAAYNKHKGNLKAQDTIMSSIMRGVTAADYICYLGTNASGNVITVGATEVEDNANNALDLPVATATITVAEGSYTYEGVALTPATVTYSENWTYGDLAITYINNDKAGTATASITYEGVTASVSFVIEEICKHENTTTTYAQVEGTETHTVTVTCACGEVISTQTADCVDADKNCVCDNCGGKLQPTVALTHISLNPGKDALGYKAAAANLPEGAHVEISLWVNENRVVTKAADTLRLVNILAYNGGEITIYAKATIVDADGNVIAESAVTQTTMRETLEAVNENFDSYKPNQQAAVKALVTKFADKLTGWKLDAIFAWTEE